MDGISTIAEMKKAVADYINNGVAYKRSEDEIARFFAEVSVAIAAERQAAALERIASVLERADNLSKMFGGE